VRTALTEALFLTNCGAPGAEAEDARVIKRLRPGDVLVVTRLDRLARSTRDLLNFLEADKRGHVLPDDGAARREAQGIVEALRRRRGNAWCVIVANEWGHDVMEIRAALRAEG